VAVACVKPNVSQRAREPGATSRLPEMKVSRLPQRHGTAPDRGVLPIRLIKAMVTIRPTGQQSNRAKPSKLVVNGMEIEPTHERKFAHISLLYGRDEEQLQQPRADLWK
jgi:hypothetical protein